MEVIPLLNFGTIKQGIMDRQMLTSMICGHLATIILGVSGCSLFCKASEARLISGWQIIQALHPQDGECIFALTDNYQQLEIIRNEFPQLRIVSLCQPHETGYRHQAFEHLHAHEKKESIIRLLTSVDILLHCCAFVGTITSGPSVFLLKVRADDPCVTAIDCPQNMLPDCLSLNIEERAAISRRTKSFWAPNQKEISHV